MKRAKIYIDDWFCGILTEDPEGYHFKYDSQYLSMPDAKALSPTMPLQEEEYEKYKEIEKALVSGNTENKMSVLSTLYALAAKLFSTRQKLSAGNETINKATEYICLNYALSNLTVSQVARECFVSEIYLRKLFGEKLNITPFYYITKVRMTHARNLIQEKIPIKEVAVLVGYNDIYQFSRAFKRFYKISPSGEMVTTCSGICLPLPSMARRTANSKPPQQGTCIRVTVTLLIF